MSQHARKRPTRLKLWHVLGLLFFAIFLFLLIATRGQLSTDRLVRALRYRNLDSPAHAAQFTISGTTNAAFTTLEDGLAVSSVVGLHIYNRRGERSVSHMADMTHPAIESAGQYVISFDVGGREYALATQSGILLHGRWDWPLIDIRPADNGFFVVSGEQIGRLGVVSVLDRHGNRPWAMHYSSGFLVTASMSSSNNTVATLTLFDGGGRIHLYTLDAGEPFASYHREGEIFFDLWPLQNGGWGVVSANTVLLFDASGNLTFEYPLAGWHLRNFARSPAGTALYITPTRTGTSGRLVTISAAGQIHETDLTGELLDLSKSGRYVAVLYHNRLDVYRAGRQYTSFPDIGFMTHARMRSDGTVFCLSAHRARLLVPR